MGLAEHKLLKGEGWDEEKMKATVMLNPEADGVVSHAKPMLDADRAASQPTLTPHFGSVCQCL